MIPRFRILRERIDAELADVQRAADKAAEAFRQAGRNSQHTTFYLDSVALSLHSFYNGAERIFESIAREIDGGLPAGPAWHRDLLNEMALEVRDLRPAVLRAQMAQSLVEYLAFRHLVRNLYTWNFEVEKLAELVARLPQTLADLKADLVNFGRFLEAATRASEQKEEE